MVCMDFLSHFKGDILCYHELIGSQTGDLIAPSTTIFDDSAWQHCLSNLLATCLV